MVTPRPHDVDAGGDQGLLAAKADLRERVWSDLQDAGAGRFPGIRHRIPNFVGAEAAADRLCETAAWRAATVIKVNPDAPQWPVRQRALEDGKTVVMATPRLADTPAFMVLDPDRLAVSPRKASSIKGATQHAQATLHTALEPIDMVVVGCVGIDRQGRRLGKGGGFADLEFAILAEAGIITSEVTVATTVHDVQVRAGVPVDVHDVPLDLVVTPTLTIRVDRAQPRNAGVRGELLTDEKVAAIPLLRQLVDR